jgi:hypothetical protein
LLFLSGTTTLVPAVATIAFDDVAGAGRFGGALPVFVANARQRHIPPSPLVAQHLRHRPAGRELAVVLDHLLGPHPNPQRVSGAELLAGLLDATTEGLVLDRAKKLCSLSCRRHCLSSKTTATTWSRISGCVSVTTSPGGPPRPTPRQPSATVRGPGRASARSRPPTRRSRSSA